MNVLTYEYGKSIHTRADLDVVLSFISDVRNLPLWTYFFKKVEPSTHDAHVTDTAVGPALTWIETSREGVSAQVDICSRLGERVEKARLRLEPMATGTNVQFRVQLPAAWGAERIGAQLDVMWQELLRLKHVCDESRDTSAL